MTTHELKILPDFYEAVISRKKTAELRLNDRDYKPGDTLILKEWNGNFTGRKVTAKITFIVDDEQYLKHKYVMLCFKLLG